jgi:uncharacterized protein YndB with AHSA1/START domain
MTDVIRITRVFDAPREDLWREWTEPERFADWFGGVQNEVPISSVTMDVRVGGAWRLIMNTLRGEIFWNGEYREVEPPERIAFTVTDQPPPADFALVTVEMVDLGDGRTEMRFEQLGPMPPEQIEAATAGWGRFFDRIDERLASSR